MAALRATGSIKITAAKVGHQLFRLQSYQAITESANVSSFPKIRMKRVSISDTPLIKRARLERPSYDAAINHQEKLALLQFYGDQLPSFDSSVLLLDL